MLSSWITTYVVCIFHAEKRGGRQNVNVPTFSLRKMLSANGSPAFVFLTLFAFLSFFIRLVLVVVAHVSAKDPRHFGVLPNAGEHLTARLEYASIKAIGWAILLLSRGIRRMSLKNFSSPCRPRTSKEGR
ncbi:hypothetical protein BDU57DRAFT_57080 [Ampelomyces quisqualis]|uniref:Uncharacterized protein n=1 Tax=Ampelomyces quisqualis TaxID=50730 RepID=A0A6A5R0V9_AMPQU|nr:hypothetical protein BDU57DRAFT_57080 [Ampelomyces quisqualis]